MNPWVDPAVWLAILGALVVGWLIGFLQAALLRGNDQPDVVGAIRKRCELCRGAWSVPAADSYDDLELCASCREGLDKAAGR